MNKAFAGVLMTGALLGSACGGEKSFPVEKEAARLEWIDGSNGQLPGNDVIEAKKRNIEADLAAADYVAQKTSNPEAIELARMGREDAVPSVLTKLGPVAISGAKDNIDEFFIISLADQDRGINRISDDYLDATINGVYINDLESLMIYERSGFSKEWQGILVLHELRHARSHQLSSVRDPYEEAKARRFQHQLALEFFKEPYLKELNATVAKMRQQFSPFIDKNEALILPDIDTSKLVDSTASSAEERWASVTLLFHSMFTLIDERFGSKDLNVHQQIYDSLVQQLGDLPPPK